MNQTEAVYEALKNLGGYSTLGELYHKTLRIPNCVWKAKDPFANIRRIVQTNSSFFRIKPGLWGLTEKKEEILKELGIIEKKTNLHEPDNESKFTHGFYQGLISELGIYRGFSTFIPAQDKNKIFLRKKLSDVSTINSIYPFTYEILVNKAKSVDVIWFNERRLPDSFFEIEHSTNITNSLLKFLNFQDFNINYFIVADQARKNDFKEKISQIIFKPIFKSTTFFDYDTLSEIHVKEQELVYLKEKTGMRI